METGLVNSDLMFALAETAAIFVAILAGFYTAKLIAIGSDKKRLLITMGEVKNDIDFRTEKKDDLASIIKQMKKETDDSRLRCLVADAKTPQYFSDLKTFEDLKNLYESHYGDLSDYASTQLKEMSEPLLKDIQKIKSEDFENLSKGKVPKNNEESEWMGLLPPSNKVDQIKASVIFDREQKVYDDYNHEVSEIEHPQKSLKSYQKDFDSMLYPSHLYFGFFSFVAFAILGVLIPISHQWWIVFLKGYSDIFAFQMFVIGLFIAFLYIFKEMLVVVRDQTS